MNEEIHDRFYDDIDGNKHFNSTQLVERYRCEGNGALCDMDCENCEFYKKFYTKEPCPYCSINDSDLEEVVSCLDMICNEQDKFILLVKKGTIEYPKLFRQK